MSAYHLKLNLDKTKLFFLPGRPSHSVCWSLWQFFGPFSWMAGELYPVMLWAVHTTLCRALLPVTGGPRRYTAVGGPCVEGQRGREVVVTFTTWGRPIRKPWFQLQREMFSPIVPSLVVSLESTMVLNAVVDEQYSHIGIPLVEVGEGSVECN
jgi:hypothetical protein